MGTSLALPARACPKPILASRKLAGIWAYGVDFGWLLNGRALTSALQPAEGPILRLSKI